jgi:hypothetical protein
VENVPIGRAHILSRECPAKIAADLEAASVIDGLRRHKDFEIHVGDLWQDDELDGKSEAHQARHAVGDALIEVIEPLAALRLVGEACFEARPIFREAVSIEPVSDPQFPANREFAGKFTGKTPFSYQCSSAKAASNRATKENSVGVEAGNYF